MIFNQKYILEKINYFNVVHLHINNSVETMSYYTHLQRKNTMLNPSKMMLGLLERLAEMFPAQHYQSELDQYIASRRPTSTADVEHFTKEFEQKISQGKII